MMPKHSRNPYAQRKIRATKNAINKVLLTATGFALLLTLYHAVSLHPYRPRTFRKPKDLRTNWCFSSATRVFDDVEFRRAYRMGRSTFNILLFLVHHQLQRDAEMAKRAGREIVTPKARLGILLRLMGGDSVYSCMEAFEVGRSTIYHIFKDTKTVLNNFLDLPGLPDSFDGLKALSDSFQESRTPPNPLPGCVGALDGIAVRIRKPAKHQHPATFYCRKGYYAIPVQALIDSNYRFLCFSAVCRGSTHDSLAHAVSSLGRYLEDGNLTEQFWIAGDEAYVCTESLITPVPASQATDVEDAFNFYHSSLRMHVEQGFGMLVRKFKILKRLELSVDESAETIGLAMKLHNFCRDYDETEERSNPKSASRRLEGQEMIQQSADWYEDGKHHYAALVGRRNRCASLKRAELIKIIETGGYVRPATVPMEVPASILRG